MDINTATPARIDGEIARIEGVCATLHGTIARSEHVIGQAEECRASGEVYAADLIARHTESIATCRTRLAELGAQLAPLEAEYRRRGGWTRTYLVDNTGGHVHTTTACRNTYPTTRFAWITDLSGSTPEEVVALAGARTCLTCFAEVRAEIVAGRPCLIETPERKAAREVRDAEKAARAAARAVKAITNPDGSPLRIDYCSGVIGTVVTATREYVAVAADAQEWETKLQWAREDFTSLPQWIERCTMNATTYRRDAEIVLAALAHKHGVDVETMRGQLAERVARRVRENR